MGMSLYWCGWDILDDDDRPYSWPDNMCAWWTGGASDGSYTTWACCVEAESKDAARAAYTSATGELEVRDRWDPDLIDAAAVATMKDTGRFPGLRTWVDKRMAVKQESS